MTDGGMVKEARIAGRRSRALRERWAERDRRYVAFHRGVTDAETDHIRQWRWAEAAEIGNLELMREGETWLHPTMRGQ